MNRFRGADSNLQSKTALAVVETCVAAVHLSECVTRIYDNYGRFPGHDLSRQRIRLRGLLDDRLCRADINQKPQMFSYITSLRRMEDYAKCKGAKVGNHRNKQFHRFRRSLR
jgi:hypothetical protein